jgi:hypothetical protein
MQDRKKLTPDEISEYFSELSRRQISELEKSGAGAVLRQLSAAVRHIQDAGVDISIDLHKGQYSDAYDMMFTALEPKAGYIPVYGFVKSGDAVKLFAIVTRMDDSDVCKALLSEHVSGEKNSRISWASSNKVSAAAFHFDSDENALASLQTALLSFAADMHAVKSFDSENVFGKAAPKSAGPGGKSGLRRPK